MKHTKGPWILEFENEPLAMNGIGTFAVYGPKGIICSTEESTIEETEANARLIAAAPELLEALEDCVKLIQMQNPNNDPDALMDAYQAIAKARGES